METAQWRQRYRTSAPVALAAAVHVIFKDTGFEHHYTNTYTKLKMQFGIFHWGFVAPVWAEVQMGDREEEKGL